VGAAVAARRSGVRGEPPELEGPASFTYVGGIFDPEPDALPEEVATCIRQGGEPLVVTSLSTTYMHQEQQLATAMAALGGLRGIITVGPGLDTEDLDPPAGVVTVRWAAHECLLPHADVVVTHAGHGTVIAALACGVPLVCMPMGRDQRANAEQIARLGAGVCIDAAVDASQLRTAVDEVLSDPKYRAAAAMLAKSLGELGGGEQLADEIESLMAAPAATTQSSTIRKES
jgi:MGT family glycosyltransferase